jgi:hypothetical protein
MPEYKVFGPVKILPKTYFVLFLRFLGGLLTVTNGEN